MISKTLKKGEKKTVNQNTIKESCIIVPYIHNNACLV